jgi:hypothetical protein
VRIESIQVAILGTDVHHAVRHRWRGIDATAATEQHREHRPVSEALLMPTSGAFSNACASLSDSQFPTRTPMDLAPFTRAMPAASSGASSPLSAASTDSFRTAVIRTL